MVEGALAICWLGSCAAAAELSVPEPAAAQGKPARGHPPGKLTSALAHVHVPQDHEAVSMPTLPCSFVWELSFTGENFMEGDLVLVFILIASMLASAWGAPALAHVDVVQQRQVQAKQPPALRQLERKVAVLLGQQPACAHCSVMNVMACSMYELAYKSRSMQAIGDSQALRLAITSTTMGCGA